MVSLHQLLAISYAGTENSGFGAWKARIQSSQRGSQGSLGIPLDVFEKTFPSAKKRLLEAGKEGAGKKRRRDSSGTSIGLNSQIQFFSLLLPP